MVACCSRLNSAGHARRDRPRTDGRGSMERRTLTGASPSRGSPNTPRPRRGRCGRLAECRDEQKGAYSSHPVFDRELRRRRSRARVSYRSERLASLVGVASGTSGPNARAAAEQREASAISERPDGDLNTPRCSGHAAQRAVPGCNLSAQISALEFHRHRTLAPLAVWCRQKRPDGDLNSGPWLRKPRG